MCGYEKIFEIENADDRVEFLLKKMFAEGNASRDGYAACSDASKKINSILLAVCSISTSGFPESISFGFGDTKSEIRACFYSNGIALSRCAGNGALDTVQTFCDSICDCSSVVAIPDGDKMYIEIRCKDFFVKK